MSLLALRRIVGSLLLCTLFIPATSLHAQRAATTADRLEREPDVVTEEHDRLGDPDRDSPEKVLRRELWFMRARVVPGKNSADLLRKANEYKIQQRGIRIEMEKVRRQLMAASGTTIPSATVPVGSASTVWTPLGPRPIVHDPVDGQVYGNAAGRVSAVAVDQADATGATVYVGGAYGGVWKSTNATAASASSVTWTPIIDQQATLAVGAIAVNGNVVLVGTGEAKSAIDSYYGQGILRSGDGGTTWTQIKTADAGATNMSGLGFGHIVFSKDNASLVVATAMGTGLSAGLGAITGSFPRGIFYSTDAGVTWHSVTISEGGIVFQATANGLVYDGTAHKFFVALRYHGIYSSTDGITWTRLTAQPGTATLANCPSNFSGAVPNSCPFWRGEIAIRPDKSEMYVWYANDQYHSQGVFKSTNGGSAWTSLTATSLDTCDDTNACITYQLFYNMTMAAVPNKADSDPNATDVYVGSGNLFKCTINTNNPSCGSTLEPYKFMDVTHVYRGSCMGVAKVHPDQHAIAYSNAVPAIVYFGNDGGIYRTLNSPGINTQNCTGVHLPFDNLNDNIGALTQFVWATPDPTDATGVLAGAQDNGTSATGAAFRTNHGISGQQFWEVMSGDGGHTDIRSDVSPNSWYQSFTDATINVCTQGSNCGFGDFASSTFIDNTAASGDNLGGDSSAFYAPFLVDPQVQTKFIVGTCRIWRGSSSTPYNGAAISPNFNTSTVAVCTDTDSLGNPNAKIQSIAMGGPTTANGSQAIYVGLDNGDVWATLTADSGANTTNWVKVTPSTSLNPGAAPAGFAFGISSIAVDRSDTTGRTAYVAIQGFGANHVLMTTNGGTSWTSIAPPNVSLGLPDAPVNSIAIDPDDHTVIYVGTDVGVFVTTNGGGSWTEVGPTEPGGAASGFLPNTVVTHIAISKAGGSKTLVATTYGRGVWTATIANQNQAPQGAVGNVFNASNQSTTLAQNATLWVDGWAADAEDGAPVSAVHVLIDGSLASDAVLGDSRPDVASFFGKPAWTNSGWHLSYNIGTLAAGTHTVTAVAVDSQNSQTTLGSSNITVVTNTPPVGSMGHAFNQSNQTTTLGQAGNLWVDGWAADNEDGAPVTKVAVLIDGNLAANATLGDPRPDVASFFSKPAWTNSGYHLVFNIGAMAAGSHTVSAVAYDSQGSTTVLGSSNFTVIADTAPQGAIGNVFSLWSRTTTIPQYGVLWVDGWAVDAEDGAPIPQVQVLVDGNAIGNATQGVPRPDVAAFFNNPNFTNSGWHVVNNIGNLSVGTHTVSAIVYDSAGTTTAVPGTTITVTANTAPVGQVEHVVGTKSQTTTVGQFANLFVDGWVADNEDGAPIAQVAITIDNNQIGLVNLGLSRPDVAAAQGKPSWTNSGFNSSNPIGNVSPGTHTVQVYAYDSVGGQTLLGTQTITVVANTAPIGATGNIFGINTGTSSVPQNSNLWVDGFAADNEDNAPITSVAILIDGGQVTTATLGLSRPDVASFFSKPAWTNSGWNASYNIGSLALGSHTVTVIAMDSAGAMTQIGSGTITVVSGNTPPVGAVGHIFNQSTGLNTISQNGNLWVDGWAADNEDNAPVSSVTVNIDNSVSVPATLGDARSDVASFFSKPLWTNSGFHLSYNIGTLALGSHTVTVIATDSGGASTTLGQGTITVQ